MTHTTANEPPLLPLHWLGRRLILPGLCAALAVDAALFLVWGLPVLAEISLAGLRRLPAIAILTFSFTLIPVFTGLIVVGLPAGLLVARLRLGLAESLLGLAALGAVAGAVGAGVLGPGLGTMDLVMAAIFGLAVAAPAAIWTWLNADLFRRNNGA